MHVQWRLTLKCEGLAKGLAVEDLVPLKHNGRSETQCSTHFSPLCLWWQAYTYTNVRTYVRTCGVVNCRIR